MSVHDTNLDLFCKNCGTLVPLTYDEHIICPLCKTVFETKPLEDMEIKVDVKKDLEEITTNQGTERTIINERCPECGKEGLYFSTAQIRSADEGQTIFYECIHCHYKYQQNA